MSNWWKLRLQTKGTTTFTIVQQIKLFNTGDTDTGDIINNNIFVIKNVSSNKQTLLNGSQSGNIIFANKMAFC